MGTVTKAIALLDLFSESEPEIGLSELARRSGHDKATTRRLLVSLGRAGFVEQSARTHAYRLGPAVLRLARVREAHQPIDAVTRPILARLSQETGETAHFSLASGEALATIGLCESNRANRVRLEQGERLPYHATASGIVFLAFSPATAAAVLSKDLPRFTQRTVVDAEALRDRMEAAKRDGYYAAREGFEDGVFGLAAPIFDIADTAIGTIAVAAPLSRVDATTEDSIRDAVLRAARDVHLGLGVSPNRYAA